jgi:hypothetical protein
MPMAIFLTSPGSFYFRQRKSRGYLLLVSYVCFFFLVRKRGMVNERGNLLLVPQLRAAAIILQIKQHFLGTGREFCFDSGNNSCSEWAKNANHVQAELGAENGRG